MSTDNDDVRFWQQMSAQAKAERVAGQDCRDRCPKCLARVPLTGQGRVAAHFNVTACDYRDRKPL